MIGEDLGRLPPIREVLFRISPFVRCRPESDIPRVPVEVSVAADIAVRVRQSVLRERPEQDLGARRAPDEEIIEIMGARTRYFLA